MRGERAIVDGEDEQAEGSGLDHLVQDRQLALGIEWVYVHRGPPRWLRPRYRWPAAAISSHTGQAVRRLTPWLRGSRQVDLAACTRSFTMRDRAGARRWGGYEHNPAFHDSQPTRSTARDARMRLALRSQVPSSARSIAPLAAAISLMCPAAPPPPAPLRRSRNPSRRLAQSRRSRCRGSEQRAASKRSARPEKQGLDLRALAFRWHRRRCDRPAAGHSR